MASGKQTGRPWNYGETSVVMHPLTQCDDGTIAYWVHFSDFVRQIAEITVPF